MHSVLALLPFASVALASQHVFDVGGLTRPPLWNRTCNLEEEDMFFLKDLVCPSRAEHDHVETVPKATLAQSPNEPWTQPPSCLATDDEADIFCIYTSSTFAHNRGISIFTTPAVAKHLAQSAAFTDASVHEGVNVESNPPYTVQPLPGRGMGVIANRTLHRGDSIFSYTPVTIIHRRTFEVFEEADRFPFQRDAVERLPEQARKLFLALHGHFGGDNVDDIIHTNSFQVYLGEDGEAHNVILPETSRINHDCRPSAHYYFDVKTLSHHVHAIRTIHAGEELSISYTDSTASHATRQAAINRSWGFDCSCSTCTQRDIFVEESDRRLQLIADLEKHLDDWTDESTATPEMADTLISLYEQERLLAPIANGYTYAALAYNAVGKEFQAMKYAALAIESSMLNSGPSFSDVQTMKELIVDPKEHWSWNMRVSK